MGIVIQILIRICNWMYFQAIKYYSTILVATLILICYTSLNAHNPTSRFERISIDEGLSQSSIYCIYQDSKGYMWFGTGDGLNRYDGYNFKVYHANPFDSTSLSDNWITSLFEDSFGTLWIGTHDGGLNKFNCKDESFTRYFHNPGNPKSISDNRINSIYKDPFDTQILWIATAGGINKFNINNEQFEYYQHNISDPNSLSNNGILSIYTDFLIDKRILWVGTWEGGLNKFDVNSDKYIRYKHNSNDQNSISSNIVWSIYKDHTGILWVGTSKGLDIFDSKANNFIHFFKDNNINTSLEESDVRSIFEDKSGNLWIGTDGDGIIKIDKEREKISQLISEPANTLSLSDNRIRSIFEDSSGIIWIGTFIGGVNKFDKKKQQFNYYHHHSDDTSSLSSNFIKSIFEDASGNLWVGTWDGLNRINRATNQIVVYKNEPFNPNSISDNHILCIKGDSDSMGKTLWIGTWGGGLNKFDRIKNKFTRYEYDPENDNSLSNNFIRCLYIDTDDENTVLWIGTDIGLNKFDIKNEKFTRYLYDSEDPYSLSNNFVKTIYKDDSGILWIGTDGGLNKFDTRINQFIHYKYNPDDLNSISNNRIRSIYEDSNGNLWVGTYIGLNRFDQKNNKFIHYYEKDGLPNDVIYGILGDNQGNIWLSTNKGLSKFNPQTGIFRNYDISDGLQSDEFNMGAYYKSKTGEMFFGGINGLNYFYPDKIRDNSFIPPVVLTSFKIYDKSVKLNQPIDEIVEIELSYKDNFFSFEFASLDYSRPEKNEYAYMMEGFDKEWIYSGTRRYASYTNLEGGEYYFRVKGSNDNGIWNEDGTSVKINISLAPWETWWAYSLYILLILIVVMGYVALRTKQQSKEIERQRLIIENVKESDKLKAEIIKNHEKYKTIVESSHDLIWITDLNGYFTFINTRGEEITGHSADEIIGADFAKYIHSDDLFIAKESFRRVIEEREVHTCELRVMDKYGMYVSLFVSEVPVIENGEIVGVMAFGLDITQRKETERELKKSFDQVRSLSKHLQDIREEEKTRMAREMHDDLGQALTALKIDLSWLNERLPENDEQLFRKTDLMFDLIDDTIQRVDSISKELRPGLLDDLGLAAAIKWQTREFKNRTGINCKVKINPEEIVLSEDRSTAIFRIFQEALTNIARHAEATKVDIVLETRNDKLYLKVADNGKGITEEQIYASKSYGLIGMQERVYPWNGTVDIVGSKNMGTTVSISILL